MKFKYLEEGKRYCFIKNQAIEYIIKDKLLWSVNDNCYSCLSANDISELDFKEVPQYVTFKEAIEHMKSGGKATYYNEIVDFYMAFECGDYCLYTSYSDKKAVFTYKMLEPKWLLL